MQKQDLLTKITTAIGKPEERSYRSIGPAIGGEVSRSAVIAVLVASLLIMLYLAWAFRQVPHPIRYGVCAVIALVAKGAASMDRVESYRTLLAEVEGEPKEWE